MRNQLAYGDMPLIPFEFRGLKSLQTYIFFHGRENRLRPET
jgi:hypothetical protein